MLQTAEQLFIGDKFTFQHDLAPAHNAKSTETWFTTYDRQTLQILIPSKIFGEEDGCSSTDYFGVTKGIHQAGLELHYTCRLLKVSGIHAKTSSDCDNRTTKY